MRQSKRVESLKEYAFAEVDKEVEKLKAKGINVIDFGVGDPKSPTPGLIRNYCKRALDKRMDSGYPSYIGDIEYRETIAKWTKNRFNVDIDPEKEICSSIGAKEAVFHFPLGFVNKNDYVISPNPGYPPYERGTLFADGKNCFYNLVEENDFLLNIDDIPKDIIKKTKILWINYPNNPTGALASKEFLKEVVDFGHDNDIIIASDECYTELYFDDKPLSILEISKEGTVVIQSLSKRSAMTGYRVGWLMGDENIINIFKKVKTNIDTGTPTFVQDAASAALLDEKHVEQFRYEYRKKRNMLVQALTSIGLDDCSPKAGIYIWQKVPGKSLDFAKKLLDPKIAIVTTPGPWLSHEVNEVNPGEGYIRFALVPSIHECKEAADRIKTLRF